MFESFSKLRSPIRARVRVRIRIRVRVGVGVGVGVRVTVVLDVLVDQLFHDLHENALVVFFFFVFLARVPRQLSDERPFGENGDA